MISKTSKSILKNQKGMTLPEIMIVLVILGSMGAFLLTQVNKALKKARVNQAKILIGEVSKALDQYNADCGFYPSELNALVADSGGKCTNWTEAYLKKMPKDPWGQELTYSSDGNKFTLKSLGEDKQEGGEGYAKDISNED